MTFVTTGIPDLDELLGGGVLAGDNVVWVGDDQDVVSRFASPLLDPGSGVGARRYVRTTTPGLSLPDGVELVDARPRRRLADPLELERVLTEAGPDDRIVIDNLDDLVRRWGTKRALAFFVRICPRLFDLGAVAYWTASRRVLGPAMLKEILKVTQCVFEVTATTLRVLKAESRPPRLQGLLVTIRMDTGEIRVEQEHVLGRLGEGLRRVREERNLSQSDLARVAGVSPSAISQAEAGRRGLALDTLVRLSESLSVGIDDLLTPRAEPDYVLARRDRSKPSRGIAPLLEDPSGGLRAYLIRLGPGDAGTPPMPHKGAELLIVASGLVLVDLGRSTPVVRVGDAVLAPRVPVRGWRNLLAEPAALFWILRD